MHNIRCFAHYDVDHSNLSQHSSICAKQNYEYCQGIMMNMNFIFTKLQNHDCVSDVLRWAIIDTHTHTDSGVQCLLVCLNGLYKHTLGTVDRERRNGERERATSHWCGAVVYPEGVENWAESAVRDNNPNIDQ